MEWCEHIAELGKQYLRGTLNIDEPMAKHVSWRAGGKAALTFQPRDLADLQAFLRLSEVRKQSLLWVGLGSNLLLRDAGWSGIVIFTHPGLGSIRTEGDAIIAEAGVAAPKLARFAANQQFAGAEFMAGIPGTIGGALAMNAGCYGGETWTFVKAIQTIDRAGEIHRRLPEDYAIGYRTVITKKIDEWFVGASFTFPVGDGLQARQKIKDLLARRVATQPLQLPNAGSVFRNPPGDHAARLIEYCGLKGTTIGGAQVSEKHANFIVNPEGKASASDIEALLEHVRAVVQRQSGVNLELEVRIVGGRAGM